MMHMLRTKVGQFKLLAYAEGVSFLMLFGITMPLKYMMDMPTPNKVVGMVHGILFMLYVAQVFIQKSEFRWSAKQVGIALVASVLPFGTFVAEKWLFR